MQPSCQPTLGVEIPGQGYGVYRIGKVGQPAEQDAARREQEGQRINQIVSQQEMTGYIDALKQKAKVKILHPVANDQGASRVNS
ncbi:hypothetical protein [Massilia eburnea]|uniref:hypothetical protein n=1 Tax=Massilia eburnea TaxID=1776165 RepID=UPI003D6C4D63